MHVAIIIVSYKSFQDVSNCLAALERALYRDFEIVVCENGGPRAFELLTAAVPRALAGGQPVRLVQSLSNLGYAGGVNLGLRETPAANAWWILNPDTEPSSEALTALTERLNVGDCDAVGGPLLVPDTGGIMCGGHWNAWLGRARWLEQGGMSLDTNGGEIERVQNFICGASILAGRRFVETAGPMREDYFLYCEEVEWCLRAIERGLRLGFAPGGRVTHYQGTTTGNVSSVVKRPRLPVFLDARNRVLLTRDRFQEKLPVASCAIFVHLLLKYGCRGAWRQLGYGLAGWWAGLRDKRGIPLWIDSRSCAGGRA